MNALSNAANAQYSRVLESVNPGVGLPSIGMQVYVESERARAAVARMSPLRSVFQSGRSR